MVGGMAAYVFYWQGEEGRSIASRKIGNALGRINSDFGRIQMSNRDFANRLSRDPALIDALIKEDRGAIAALFKNTSDARGFSGSITAYDENGKVVYSSDTPAKFGYSVRGKNSAVDYVLNNQDIFIGSTYALTIAQTMGLSALAPVINSNGQTAGVVAVSEPIDEAFLTGEAMKLGLLNEPLSNIDFVLLGVRDRGQIEITPTLLKDRPAFLKLLSDQGVKALPSWQEPGSWQIANVFNWFSNLFNKNANIPGLMGGFSKDNRFWQPFSLVAADNKASVRAYSGGANGGSEIIGVILATTPLRTEGIKPGFVILASCIMGLAAIFSIIALSTQLSTQPDENVALLTDRIKRWRSDKRLPPGKKLSDSWLELSELIDQTLIEWQSTIQGLKVQLNKAAQASNEGYADQNKASNNDEQFAALNRQLTNQSRQLSEFSKQLNQANQQSVFLQNELQAILQSTTEGFLILDQYGNVIHSNAIFSNWLGMTEAEIAGRYCFDLVRKQSGNGTSVSSQPTRTFVRHESDPTALINEFFPEGYVSNSQSGKAVDVLLHLQPITTHDNKVSGYILVARDKSLRSEVTGLKMEIVTMLARAIRGPLLSADKEWRNILAAQSKRRDQIVATVTQTVDRNVPEEIHEQLNRELNQELKPQELSFEQRLANLHSRYESLIKSVENMLATHGQAIGQMIPLTSESGSLAALDLDSLLATTEPTKESFPVSRLVGECLKEAANLASEKQLMLDYKTSTALPGITGDRALMKSIIYPVVEKMILSTQSGGKVRVESSLKDNDIQLSIASSGPALSEEETADMFSGFDPERHNEDTYGSRLALYLSRNNAERIGAKIWAQSETRVENEQSTTGTTVYIAFPIV